MILHGTGAQAGERAVGSPGPWVWTRVEFSSERPILLIYRLGDRTIYSANSDLSTIRRIVSPLAACHTSLARKASHTATVCSRSARPGAAALRCGGAAAAGNPPVLNRALNMDAPDTRSAIRRDCLSWTRSELKYTLYFPANDEESFIFTAILKVPNGVKFICEPWKDRPNEHMIAVRCAAHGQFSPRPYWAGQETDDSTLDCVLALFHSYCGGSGVDPTRLIARAYPGMEVDEKWSPDGWRQTLDAAEWHGTSIPKEWTISSVIGLIASLRHQKLTALAQALADEILRRAAL